MSGFNYFNVQVLIATAFALALDKGVAPASDHDCTRHSDQNHKHCTRDGGGGRKRVEIVEYVSFTDMKFALIQLWAGTINGGGPRYLSEEYLKWRKK